MLEERAMARAGVGVTLAVSWMVTGCGAGRDEALPIDADLAIVNVSVIAMTADRVDANQTVLVRDGMIVSISPSDEVETTDDVVTVSGDGRYLIPGLADMHVHVSGEKELELYVANGVTTVRNMWGSRYTLAMRARSASGAIAAPRIVTAGDVFDGAPPVRGWSAIVRAPEEARALMDEEKAAGFDFIKTYEMLSLETFDAIAAHAVEIGVPFAGHVPQAVRIEHALASGMASVEHMSGWRTTRRSFGPGDGEALLRKIAAGEADAEEMFDAERRRATALAAGASGVWHVPTLIYPDRIYTSRRQVGDMLARPEMRYTNPRRKAGWDPSRNPRMERLTDDRLEAIQTLVEESKRQVGDLHEAGGRILAGTDAPNPFIPHGFALHDELQLLVQSGLSPYQALVSATRGPTEFLTDSTSGTIEVGKGANLVLLRENPLQDISATRTIEGVVLRGRWLPRARLDAMLEGVVRSYEPPADWFDGPTSLVPSAGATVLTFVTTDGGYDSGAERSATVRRDDGRDLVVGERRMIALSGDRIVETVRGTMDGDVGFSELHYVQSSPSGTAEAAARLSGRHLVVSGRTVDGQPFERLVTLGAGELVACELIACLAPIVARLDGLEVGGQRQVQARRLTAAVRARGEPSGDPRLVSETWDLVRGENDGDARRYEAVVTRDAYGWSLRILVDAEGLHTVRVFDGPQDYVSERVSG